MNSKKLTANSISDEFYKKPSFWFSKIIILGIIFFILGIWLHFPLTQITEQFIAQKLNTNRSCPINYKKVKVGFLPPMLRLDQPIIPGVCFKNPNAQIKLDYVKGGFAFFGFSPLSLKFHSIIKGVDSYINLYPRIHFSGQDIRITKTKISGKLVSSFTNYPKLLKGNINVDGLFNLKKQKIEKGDLKANSNDIMIPSQTLNIGPLPFKIPALDFNHLKFLATYTKNNLNISKLELGKISSPLHIEFRGTIIPNQYNLNSSKIDLEGRFKIAEDLLNELSAIKLFLKGKPKEGYYNIKLTGTLAAPRAKFL